MAWLVECICGPGHIVLFVFQGADHILVFGALLVFCFPSMMAYPFCLCYRSLSYTSLLQALSACRLFCCCC